MASKSSQLWTGILILIICLLSFFLIRGFVSDQQESSRQAGAPKAASTPQTTAKVGVDKPGQSSTGQASGQGQTNVPPPTKARPAAPYREKAPVTADESPSKRLSKLDLPEKPKQQTLLPTEMDLQNPPQWTEPLAVPDDPKPSPDPFTDPPIIVDPTRR